MQGFFDELSVGFLLGRGSKRAEQGNYAGAMEDYNKVLRIEPNNSHAYCSRGLVRDHTGDHKGAMEDYTQALRINPYEIPQCKSSRGKRNPRK